MSWRFLGFAKSLLPLSQDSTVGSVFWLYRGMPGFESVDVNGRYCSLCSMPPKERAPNKSYLQRSDCGNSSYWEHPENGKLPLSTFMKEATAEHNVTNGWCELNFEKGCADAVYNRDYMFFAKSVAWPNSSVASYDQHFCYYNGWLSPEIRALQHDYEGLTLGCIVRNFEVS